ETVGRGFHSFHGDTSGKVPPLSAYSAGPSIPGGPVARHDCRPEEQGDEGPHWQSLLLFKCIIIIISGPSQKVIRKNVFKTHKIHCLFGIMPPE
ncbi:hypothetical protein, partial [Aminivibrio sp.]|uniref:hypothetical protein n=1 Tax=Aminivibrio sp. TaxID=1872489 RepID=UPI00345E4F76